MAIMKFKDSNGEWKGIPAFKGENGKDGAIQYQAGKGINISEDNVISSEVDTHPIAGSDNPVSSGGVYTALENKADKKYVDDNKYTLPIASSDTLGGIKIGDNLNIDENGVVSASGGNKTLLLRSDMTKEEKISVIQEFYADFLNNIIDNIIYMSYKTYGKYYDKYVLSSIGTNTNNNFILLGFVYMWNAEQLGSANIISYRCYYNPQTNAITSFDTENYSYQNLTAYNRSVTVTRNNQALGVNNTMEFIPTGDYNPATKKYVDDSMNKANENINNLLLPILPQNLVDNGFDYLAETKIIPNNYTVENISMAYEFELNENGYYESNNKGVDNSYSLCKVTFNNEQPLSIPISYISSGENNYDYGIFSNIDQILSSSNSDDGATGSEKVFKSCKGESSTEVKEIVYEIPSGEHFIHIKYKKDGSGNNGNDSLQFKIPSTIPQEVYENRKMATTKYVDAKLKGYYYMELSLGMLGVGDEDYVNNELPVEKHQPFKEIIDTINNDNVKQPKLIIANTDDTVVADDGTIINNPLPRYIEISEINKSTTIEEGKTHYTLQGVCNPIRSNTDTSGNYVDMIAQIFIGGVESDNGYTVEHVFINLKMCMLPTKKYIDDAVANAGGEIDGLPRFFIECDISEGSSPIWYNKGTEMETKLTNAINEAYNSGVLDFVLVFGSASNKVLTYLENRITINDDTKTLNTQIISKVVGSSGSSYRVQYIDLGYGEWKYINGSWSYSSTGNMVAGQFVSTPSYVTAYQVNQNYLNKSNTTSYTPTSDYNPATKKYVDDAVSGSSGGITSETDPIFVASEAYKITASDTANWNNKVDATQVNNILNSKSYLTSESDPVFSASEAAKITSTDTANWNNKVDITAVNNAINTTLNSKSYLTSETDPTVPAWAKQPNKPTYTASEVGALPASTVIPTVPSKLSGFQDDLGTNPVHTHSQYLTAHQDISGKQNKVLYGTADPTSDIGVEGDIYIKYV